MYHLPFYQQSSNSNKIIFNKNIFEIPIKSIECDCTTLKDLEGSIDDIISNVYDNKILSNSLAQKMSTAFKNNLTHIDLFDAVQFGNSNCDVYLKISCSAGTHRYDKNRILPTIIL